MAANAFSWASRRGNICCRRTQNISEGNQKHFFVRNKFCIEVRAEWRLTLFLGRADGETFVAGGHKIFLKEIRNIFLFATNFARTSKQGNICVRKIVSSFAITFRKQYRSFSGNFESNISAITALGLLNSYHCMLTVVLTAFISQKNRSSAEKVNEDLAKQDAKKLYEVNTRPVLE